MNEFDLATELRRFRENAKLSEAQMAENLVMNVHRYKLIEHGSVQPTPDEVTLCRNFLNRQKYRALPPPPWYKRGIWTWIIPAFGSILLAMLVIASKGFSEGFSEGNIETRYPYGTLIVASVVFFALYWFIYWLIKLFKKWGTVLLKGIKKRWRDRSTLVGRMLHKGET